MKIWFSFKAIRKNIKVQQKSFEFRTKERAMTYVFCNINILVMATFSFFTAFVTATSAQTALKKEQVKEFCSPNEELSYLELLNLPANSEIKFNSLNFIEAIPNSKSESTKTFFIRAEKYSIYKKSAFTEFKK